MSFPLFLTQIFYMLLGSQILHNISGTRLWEVTPWACWRSWLNLCLSVCNVLPAPSSLLYWGKFESPIMPPSFPCASGEDTQDHPQLSSHILERRWSWRQNNQVVNAVADVISIAKSGTVFVKAASKKIAQGWHESKLWMLNWPEIIPQCKIKKQRTNFQCLHLIRPNDGYR